MSTMALSIPPFKPAQRPFLSFVVLAVIALLLVRSFVSFSPLSGTVASSSSGWSYLDPIKNRTLGFEKVLAMNLPSRQDKRDNLVLGASATEINIDWVDGVSPDDVDPKSYPSNWDAASKKPGEIGAWRAHMNAVQQVVEDGLSTALILEDDPDWDVTLKNQLQGFALATRALQGSNASAESPYGDGWDLLWLGHCGLLCRSDQPFYSTPNDPTVVPGHYLPGYWREHPPVDVEHGTRYGCTMQDGVCSLAYAVTWKAARKILNALSVKPSVSASQFDVSLSELCSRGDLKCLSAFPSIIGNWRAAGPKLRQSDIHDDEGVYETGFPTGVMYSTMLNIERIVDGESTVFSTWKDVIKPELNPDDVRVLEGKLQRLDDTGLHDI